jgi:diguanylate cyclase (GGDEF)-like protein
MGITISLLFATAITTFFNRSMVIMLRYRESSMLNATQKHILNLLKRDANYLSSSLMGWATKSETHKFVYERNPYDQDKYFALVPLVIMRLNYVGIVANNGYISQRFFDYLNQEELPTVPESAFLTKAALSLHRQTQDKYWLMSEWGNIFYVLSHTQASGYMDLGGTIYFVTTAPILPYDISSHSNGTMIFGRRIDNENLNKVYAPSKNSEKDTLNISIEAMSAEEAATFTTDQILHNNDEHITVSSALESLDGSSIVLEVTKTRVAYKQSVAVVNGVSFLIFIFTSGLSGAFFIIADRWLICPISILSRRVENIDFDRHRAELPNFNAKEINVLSGAIVKMLRRLDDHKKFIEEQNSTLTEQNRQLQLLANYDVLTKLPNKNMLRGATESAIAESDDGTLVAMLYICVLNLRLINDACGRSIGDKTLIETARRLSSSFCAQDIVISSFGTGIFALMIPVKNREEVSMAAHKAILLFESPFSIEEHEILVNVNIGVSLYPFDGDTFDTLDSCANIAMNKARESGEVSTFLFFNRNQLDDVLRRYNRADEIKRGIERGEFRVVFQPKLNVTTNLITSSEALLRWNSPLGAIPPPLFIPDARRTGLIVPLTWEIMRMTMEANVEFIKELEMPMSVGINIPINVLLHSEFNSVLKSLLHETQMPTECLNVELTEDVLVNDMAKCADRMSSLQKIGAQISLDDFGTGYSSLQYLSKMPFDWMKIDKAFVDGLPDSPQEKAIIAASVGIARGLGMNIVMEGVETESQLDVIVSERYCEEIQGYVLSKPLERDEFVDFVGSWNESVLTGVSVF